MGLSFTLERADDAVSLAVDIVGMDARSTPDGWFLEPSGGPATITAGYPPQHVVEYADTTDAPGGQAPFQDAPIFAPGTTVVFSVPAGFGPIPLSVEGVLAALARLPMVGGPGSVALDAVADPAAIAAAARETGSTAEARRRTAEARAALTGDTIATGRSTGADGRAGAGTPDAFGTPGATSVFLPSRLELAIPSGAARLVHSAAPAQRGDVVESWHSRLAVEASGGGAPVEMTTTAVVRRGVAYQSPPATTPQNISYAAIVDQDKINSTVDDVVGVLPALTSQTPLAMKRLVLAPLGGTVELEGTWTVADGTWPTGPGAAPEPALSAYRHRVVQGRDVEIRTVRRGRLYPLGHPAVLVETTRRVPATVTQGSSARLVTQSVITVRKTTMEYTQDGPGGRAWPWQRVRILNPVSPPGVDEVHTVFGTPGEEFHRLMVDGAPFMSECRATDIGGNDITFALAQIFVPDNQNVGLAAVLWNAFAHESSPWKDRFAGFSLTGRTVMTAPPPSPGAAAALGGAAPDADATSLVVRQVTFDRVMSGVDGFRPRVAEFVGSSPAIDGLRGPTQAVFGYAKQYLDSGFDGAANAAELLLTVQAEAAALGQQAAGLVAAETAPIRALSRSIGAVAAQAVGDKTVEKVLADLAAGHFDPAAWFKLPAARLFSVFPLDALLAKAGQTVNQLQSAPRQLVELVNGTKTITVTWSTVLLGAGEEYPADPPLVALGTIEGRDLRLDLRSVTRIDLASQTVRTTNTCTVTDAAVMIGPPPQGDDTHLVTLPIRSLTFETSDSGAPDVDVQLGSVTFGGALAFVKTLADLISSSGLGQSERQSLVAARDPSTSLVTAEAPRSGPYVEVVGNAVRAGLALALPDLAIGVFSLQDLAFASSFELALDGTAPPTLTLDFATIDNPFRLTVAMIGGGGHLRVRVSTAGVVLVAGALEFGAAVAVNLAGVAKGSASVMGGVYFELAAGDVALTGYLSIKGKLSILGIISVAVEVNLALSYFSDTKKIEGEAELVIKIKVLFFKKTVRFQVKRQFAGANADPTFAELMAPADWPDQDVLPWDTYCTAFAPV